MNEKIHKILSGAHCRAEHNMQYEVCYDCAQEAHELIKELGEENQRYKEALEYIMLESSNERNEFADEAYLVRINNIAKQALNTEVK